MPQYCIDDIMRLLYFLQAEPKDCGDHIEARTVCHQGESQKLFWYLNSQLFYCYTECGSFNIYGLIMRTWDYDYLAARNFLEGFFGNVLQQKTGFEELLILEEYQRNLNKKEENIVLLEYDYPLDRYPQPRILHWEQEGIKPQIYLREFDVHYNPLSADILIPHRDENKRLVGIRKRTIVQSKAALGFKYMPATLGYKQYNHPLGLNLYGIDKCPDVEEVVVFEGEKSVLKYHSLVGENAVAVCGQQLNKHQIIKLRAKGCKEIIVAYDNDGNFNKLLSAYKNIYEKYNHLANFSFIVDSRNILNKKDSPIDQGKNIWEKLYRGRVRL